MCSRDKFGLTQGHNIGRTLNSLILDRGTEAMPTLYSKYGMFLQIGNIYQLSGRCKFGMSLLVYGSAIPTATTVDARNGGIQGKTYGETTCTTGNSLLQART